VAPALRRLWRHPVRCLMGTAAARSLRSLDHARRWVFRGAGADDAAVSTLESELRLPRALCRLLALRGLSTPEDASHFLKPALGDLHDPHLLVDADVAVARITSAVRARERILVHGDYDVDGMCAAALYTRVLRS